MLLYMDLGKGLGLWKTIPILLLISMGSAPDEYMSMSSCIMEPSRRKLAMRSFILFRHRRKVDLPHPDGPIRAVTLLVFISMFMSFSTRLSPYQALSFDMVNERSFTT